MHKKKQKEEEMKRKIQCISLILILVLFVSTTSAFAKSELFSPINGSIDDTLAAPTSFSADTVSLKKIKLSWKPVYSASGYEIFRRSYGTKSYGEYKKIATIEDPTVTTYYDTNGLIINDKPYLYAIRAYYKVSDTYYYYSEHNLTPDGTNSTVGSTTITEQRVLVKKSNNKKLAGIKLSWTKVNYADGYEITYRDIEDGNSSEKKISVSKNKTTYTIKNSKLVKGHPYTIEVRAYRIINGKKHYGLSEVDLSTSRYTTIYAIPLSTAAPKNVRIDSSDASKTYLKWDSVSGVKVYKIYVRNSVDEAWRFETEVYNGSTSYDISDYAESTEPVYFSISSGKEVPAGTYYWDNWYFSSKKSKSVSLNTEYDTTASFKSEYVKNFIQSKFCVPVDELKLWQIIDNLFHFHTMDNFFFVGMSPDEVSDAISDLQSLKINKFAAYGLTVSLDGSNNSVEYFKAIYNTVSKVITRYISDNMSDYEKAKVLHDYLVNNMSYSYEIMTNGSSNPHVYDALVLGTGVCHDYAAAYKILCEKAGLECCTVSSNTHAWNIVNIDGEWYNVDCTWDDPVGGSLRYTYFLISDSLIESIGLPDHTRNAYCKANYPACPKNYK